jgi:hypothetical protein
MSKTREMNNTENSKIINTEMLRIREKIILVLTKYLKFSLFLLL